MSKTDGDRHFFGQVAQKALIVENDQVLLVKYPDNDPAGGTYDMPGGRLHAGELPLDAIKREVKEEISAEIEIAGIACTGVFDGGPKGPQFFVIYRAKLKDPDQAFVPEAGEIERVGWFDAKDFFGLPIIHPEYKEALRTILV